MTKPKQIDEADVRKTVAEFVVCDPTEIVDRAHFEDDLGLDSIDRIDLLTEVERSYRITFSDAQITTITTFSQLMRTLNGPTTEDQ